jgi:hypothetical protein
LAVAVLLPFGLTQIRAQAPQPFSADFVTTAAQGKKMAGKWYVAMPKMPMDITSMPQQSQAQPDPALFVIPPGYKAFDPSAFKQ